MSVPLIHHLIDHSSLFLPVSSRSNSIHHPYNIHPSIHHPSIRPPSIHPPSTIHPPSIHPSASHPPSIHPPSTIHPPSSEHLDLVFHFRCSAFYFCFTDYAEASDCVDHNKLWKTLEEMGIPDHLTFLLRKLHADQEAAVRTGHGTTDWFQIGKRVCQACCILSPCLLNLYAEYIM